MQTGFIFSDSGYLDSRSPSGNGVMEIRMSEEELGRRQLEFVRLRNLMAIQGAYATLQQTVIPLREKVDRKANDKIEQAKMLLMEACSDLTKRIPEFDLY